MHMYTDYEIERCNKDGMDVHCTLYSVQCTIYCTLYSVHTQCIMYTVQVDSSV